MRSSYRTPVSARVLDARAEERMDSVTDGVRVQRLGARNAAVLHAHLHAMLTVTEAEVQAAMRRLYREDGLVVEGAGAVAVAGLPHVAARRRVAVVSGGNVDPELFRRVVGRGARGRFCALRGRRAGRSAFRGASVGGLIQ